MIRKIRRIAAVGALAGLLSAAVAAQPITGGSAFNVRDLENPRLAVMTSDLLQARQEILGGAAPGEAMQRHAAHAVRGGQLQVIIGVREISDDVLAAIEQAGLEITHRYSHGDHHMLTVRCDSPLQLDALTGLTEVRGITAEPMATTRVGSVANQADVSINADDARTAYSVDGTGVRVGVMSDSFHDTRGGSVTGGVLTGCTDQTSGDLPSSIRMIDAGPGGQSDEGNGMAQLIYDLAPGCDISFASAFTSYPAFATNITALHADATAPADVIVDDVIYYTEPVYQNGPIAIAANGSYAAGVPYFSSAGNAGSNAHEQTYVDVNPGTDDTAWPPSGNDMHDFGAAAGMATDTRLSLNLPSGGQVIATLHWTQPYGGTLGAGPGSETDLDLHLVNAAQSIVSSSTSVQGTAGAPAGDAVEFINNSSLGAGVYHLIVEHYDGNENVTVRLGVSVRGSGASVTDAAYLGARTVYGHAAAEKAMAVAAMFYGEIDLNGGASGSASVLDVESFSALGGNIPFLYSDSGLPLASTQTRFKPEITAPDGTNTTFFGSDIAFDADAHPNFFGTSAAAPHAAAVAALMLERANDLGVSLPPSQVYSVLRASARDVESAGADFWSGDGLIDAVDAVAAAVNKSLIEVLLGQAGQAGDGDVNSDGAVNAADIVTRVNMP